MNTVRVANLKSIRDSKKIEIKPITILVGKNSSGKSSFLRLFSLLRQSVEVRTRSPFLWYGQYVDFGSFNEALRRGSEPQQIVFEFSFKISEDLLNQITLPRWSIIRHIKRRLSFLKDASLCVELTLVCPRSKAYFSKIVLTLNDDVFTISIDESDNVSEFTVNDLDILSLTEECAVFEVSKFIPILMTKKKLEDSDRRDYFSYVFGGLDLATQEALVKQTYFLFHGNTSDYTRNSTVNKIGIEPLPQFYETLLSIPAGDSYKSYVKLYSGHISFLNKIRNLSLASITAGLLFLADEELSRVALNVRSIAPVRAVVERYYRKQDLGIDEVDYKGQNLVMYLSGLTVDEIRYFQDWTLDNLKFLVSVKDSAGHVEVFLQETEGTNKYNLADSGFGYSQILPIVAQLWSILNPAFSRRYKPQATNIFTIEQPELHLHPSLQAKTADLFIAAINKAKATNIDLRLLVETHSEAIINRIGNQIAKGNLSSVDVNVVMFEKKDPIESTEVLVASYDKNGYLINWPYGFFEAEED